VSYAPKNEILTQIEPAIALKVGKRLELIEIERGHVLQETGSQVEWVWFPESALICVAAENVDGESVSGGMIGREGMFGAFEACGSRLSYARAAVQIGGIRIEPEFEQVLDGLHVGFRGMFVRHAFNPSDSGCGSSR